MTDPRQALSDFLIGEFIAEDNAIIDRQFSRTLVDLNGQPLEIPPPTPTFLVEFSVWETVGFRE